MDVGKNIRAIRDSKRITQIEVASDLDLDVSSYARIEKRGNRITLEQLEKIAWSLGVSVLDLMTEGEGVPAKGHAERVSELENEVRQLKERNEELKDSRKLLALRERDLQTVETAIIDLLHYVADDEGFKVGLVKQDWNPDEEAIRAALERLKKEEPYLYLFIGDLLERRVFVALKVKGSGYSDLVEFITENYDMNYYQVEVRKRTGSATVGTI